MPVVSKKQGKFMQAVANNPKFANKVGVNQSIGKEFTKEKGMKTKKMNMGGMADREGRAMAAGRLAGRPGMMADARGRAMMKKGGNTSRTNEIEELGRVDAEKGYSAKGKRNLKDEKARVVREIKNKKAGGKVGYAGGGKVSMTSMKDREGRALAKDKKGMTAAQMRDARGRAMGKAAKAGAKAGGLGMKKGGAVMKAKDKAMKAGGMLARTGGSSAKMKAKGKKMMGGGKVKAYKKGGAVSSASKRADGIAQKGHTRGRHV